MNLHEVDWQRVQLVAAKRDVPPCGASPQTHRHGQAESPAFTLAIVPPAGGASRLRLPVRANARP